MFTVTFYEGHGFIERREVYDTLEEACAVALLDDSAKIYKNGVRLI